MMLIFLKKHLYVVLLLIFSCTNLKTSNNKTEKPIWVAKKYTYKASREKKVDLLHTKLDITPDWDKKELIGSAELSFTPYFYPQKEIQIDAKSFEIKSIKLDNGQSLIYQYDSLELNIQLDKEYTKSDTFNIHIEYIAKPYQLYKQGHKDLVYTKEHGLYFINSEKKGNKPSQIWTQGEPEFNSCWFPTIDSPNEKTTQETLITVESKYQTLSNGLFIYSVDNENGTRTDYWRQEIPHSPYLFMLAIGEYSVIRDKWEEIPVYYYLEPQYKELTQDIYGQTPAMLDFYSQKLGVKYPWEKYAQVTVRDFMWGGMENTSATIYTERIQQNKREKLDRDYEYLLAHELAHHWFGDYLTAESWANLPLNESFATYSEYLWIEGTYNKDRADHHLKKELDGYLLESNNKQEPIIRYCHSKDLGDMFDAHTYNKGSVVLHQLRNTVGDKAFFTSVKKYLQNNALKSVEIHDLRLAFEETTGKDLNWFFNQWFLSPGHPKLKIEHQYQDKKLILNIQQLQDTNYTGLYQIPTKISYWLNGQKHESKINIHNKHKQEIIIPIAEKPQAIQIGADQILLAEIKHTKSTEEILNQIKYSDTYTEKSNAINQLNQFDSLEINTNSIQIAQLLKQEMLNPQEAIRIQSINQLQKLNLEEDFTNRLKQLAKTDKKSSVRNLAYQYLIHNNSIEKEELVKGLKDSSYKVMSTCLQELIERGDTAYFDQYQSETNYTVSKVIANYIIENKIKNKEDWFLQRVKSYDWVYTYRFTSLLGKYVHLVWEEINSDKQKEILSQLQYQATHHELHYIRKASYNALKELETKETVKDRLEKIRSSEHNSDMIKYYQEN